MIEKQSTIPSRSILKKNEATFHYIDSFQSPILGKGQRVDIAKFVQLFLSGGPKWADTLFEVRNKAVRLFGLKVSSAADRQKKVDITKLKVGEQVGIFRLFEKAENEVVLGEDDKHLNFRVSLFIDQHSNGSDKKRLSITTAVRFNNAFGRIYFLPVKPFHKWLVRSSLKKIIQKIEGKTEYQTNFS